MCVYLDRLEFALISAHFDSYRTYAEVSHPLCPTKKIYIGHNVALMVLIMNLYVGVDGLLSKVYIDETFNDGNLTNSHN